MHDTDQARRGRGDGQPHEEAWKDLPFGEGLLLDINPLLLDRQHLQFRSKTFQGRLAGGLKKPGSRMSRGGGSGLVG